MYIESTTCNYCNILKLCAFIITIIIYARKIRLYIKENIYLIIPPFYLMNSQLKPQPTTQQNDSIAIA